MDTCTLEFSSSKLQNQNSDSNSIFLILLSSLTLDLKQMPNTKGFSSFIILEKFLSFFFFFFFFLSSSSFFFLKKLLKIEKKKKNLSIRFQVADTRKNKTLFPFIVSPKQAFPDRVQKQSPKSKDSIPFLSFYFERFPPNENVDTKVNFKMQPLDIVFNKELVERVVKIFQEQLNDPLLQSLQSIAKNQLENIKNETSKKIESIWKSQEVFSFFLFSFLLLTTSFYLMLSS